MQRRGKTFIVSGPSGVGKSTVLKALFDQRTDLYFSISATTRDPRPGEVDGVHYHFIPAEEFHRMVEEDEFLEYAEYVGNFYGTPKKYVDRAMDDGRDVILDIEIQGANQICAKRPETVRIFIAPPSWVELERRLTARGTDSQESSRAACCGPRWSCKPPAATTIWSSMIPWSRRWRRWRPFCAPSTAARRSVWSSSCINKSNYSRKADKEGRSL